MIELAPSILSADFSQLGQQVREALDWGAKRIHVDVMDGHFVPNITIGPLIAAAIESLVHDRGAILEVHLMIEQPERYLADFAKAGGDLILVHVETCPHLHRTVQTIHELGKQAGVVLNPATPLVALEEILPDVEQVLLMTVNPGFGGQAFIPGSLDKIRRLAETLRKRGLADRVHIEVDGGVHQQTIRSVREAGATVAVAGSAVFNREASIAENLERLHRAAG